MLSSAHLPQSAAFMGEPFVQKNRKLAKMLTSLGHEVFFYGAEGSDVEEYCNSKNLHFIQTHTLADIKTDYSDGYDDTNSNGLGYNWRSNGFKHDMNNTPRSKSTLKFYDSCVAHINKVKKDDDFLLCTLGNYHIPISEKIQLFLKCEPGIGYRGSVKEFFRAFESPYIQNFMYGSENPYKAINGKFYNRVIPNYFDSNDFITSNRKKNYYLFIGRLISRKGILIAYLATKAIKAKLVIAGQGGAIDPRGYLIDNQNKSFEIPNDSDWQYVGYVDLNERKRLMSEAIATFTPTQYLEPFGGTHIESMLSGTPPITTDFGVYPHTIPDYLNGKVGFRCNTLQDFVDAAEASKKVDHKFIRKYAERFLMDNVKWEYQKWFEDLYDLYESAYRKPKKGWSRIEKNHKNIFLSQKPS